MYAMRYGNYTWWNPNTYALLRQKSSSAKLTNTGGEYNGWYFYQVGHTAAGPVSPSAEHCPL
jgi:hypothetical protein